LDENVNPKMVFKIVVTILCIALLITGMALVPKANGWTWVTALCVMLFSLMHWPCSTTCLTIRKETQSWKWTLVSFLVPTLSGIVICFIVANLARLLALV